MDILVVDDESDIRDLLSEILREECNYLVESAKNVEFALSSLAKAPKVVILDIWLEGSQMDGIGLLKIIKQRLPATQVIMISGHANVDIAVKTIKLGAYDFIEKPFKTARLLIMVERAMEKCNFLAVNNGIKEQSQGPLIVGKSHRILKMKEKIDSVAAKNSRVIISGARGVGKYTVAKAIHNKSQRTDKPFFYWQVRGKGVEALLSDLYGDEKNILSVFEAANGGSLFINEILALPKEVQVQFLSALQSGRIPSDPEKSFSVRVIAATTGNIEYAVQNNILDGGLYSNLNVSRINVPSLSEVRADIPLFVEHFVEGLSKYSNLLFRKIEDAVIDIMILYKWHGNLRQLKNVVEFMMMNAELRNDESVPLTVEMLPAFIREECIIVDHKNNILNKTLKEARDLFEKNYISSQLQRFNSNISRTAEFIGMDRAALHRKIKALGGDL